MRADALLVLGTVLAIALGGCMTGSEGQDPPRTHEFTLVVHPGMSDTIGLYTQSDNSTAEAFAITFQENPDDEQRVPGPEIRVREGDTVILHLENLNGLPHTLHLHGGLMEWESDGVDYLTQFPTLNGQSFTYTFKDLKAGTYWYHCHVDGAHHIDFGMYGAFIVEERDPPVDYDREYTVLLDEWDNCHVHGNTEPVEQQQLSPDAQATSDCHYRFVLDYLAQNQVFQQTGNTVNGTSGGSNQAVCQTLSQLPEDTPQQRALKASLMQGAGCSNHAHGDPPAYQQERQWWYETMPVYNPEYNTFLINGKAFPDTPVFPVREGETVRFRIINAGNEVHTWHPHGHTMEIFAKDGYELPAPYRADTLLIAPGERYDYVMEFNNPGLWMIHDQMGQYAVNDNVHPGGMMACIAYDGFEGVDAFGLGRSLECHHEAVRILESRGAQHDH
jgi:plastocyanin